MLLEVGGARLLTDPVLRKRLAHLRRHAAAPRADVTEALDAVLISHIHRDHLDTGSLRLLSGRERVLAPRGAAQLVPDAEELTPGDEAKIGEATVRAVPAVHDGRRRPRGPTAETIGYEIVGAHRVYFAGDTDLFPGMADLATGLDLALLPVWGWGPKLGPGHLDPRGAAEALALLRPRTAVPIHWGTLFPAGLARRHPHALTDPPHAFARHAAELAPAVDVRILRPGETLDLEPR